MFCAFRGIQEVRAPCGRGGGGRGVGEAKVGGSRGGGVGVEGPEVWGKGC